MDINIQDNYGKSILHYAAQRGSLNSLDFILNKFGAKNIKFELQDKFLNTPLSIAVLYKHYEFA